MSFPGYQNSFGFPGIYFSDITAKPLNDGEGSPFLVDEYRRLLVNVSSPSPTPTAANAYTWRYKSSALERKGIARVVAALFSQAWGYIDASEVTGIYYFQIYNSTTVPADGTAAIIEIPVPHTTGTITQFFINAEQGRVYFSTGVSWSFSSTAFIKTEIATNKANVIVFGY